MLPGAALSPTIGSKLFGTSAKPLVINGQDGSRLTVVNAQITKLANLQLSVEKNCGVQMWNSPACINPGSTPDQTNSYYTYSVGNSYTAPSFTKLKLPRAGPHGRAGRHTGECGNFLQLVQFQERRGDRLEVGFGF
jgi:hypothetical protein